jgi:potassium efflux system protein
MDERRRALRLYIARLCILCAVTLLPQMVWAQSPARTWWLDSWSNLQRWFTTPFLTIGTTNINAVGVLKAAVVVLLALGISRLLRRGLRRVSKRLPNLDRSTAYTLGRVLHYVILVVALFVGLAVIGVDLTKIAIVAGALSVGVGFGLQNIVNNFVSGLILLFERTIKVGDYIELASGITGEVRDINIRSTIVTTNDNVDIVVPNSELVSTSVTNWTLREAVRRIRIPFGVAYGSDKETVRVAALEAAATIEHTLHTEGRRPEVWLVGFGDSSLNFELIVWLTATAVKRPARIAAEYNWELETALRKHGLEIPFPQRDIHVRSAPGLRSELLQSAEVDHTEEIA